MVRTRTALKLAVRVAAIQHTNRLEDDESVSGFRVPLNALRDVIAGEQTAVFVPAFPCNTCVGVVFQILL